jgi:hypothetical protein
MDKALARVKVPHELITVEGAGHGIGDAKPEVIAKVYERAATFLIDALK